MEDKLLEEFILIGTETIEDGEAIFQLTTAYLSELKTQKFNAENASMLEGLINKMVVISENLNFEQNFVNIIEADLENFVNSVNSTGKANGMLFYNKLYSDTMKFHNLLTKTKPKKQTGIGPFQPDKSDKPRISFLISEVISLIQNSDYLTDKVKTNLTEKLSQVLVELNSEKTNWGIYFKQMGNAIMIISALAAIPSGIESVANLISVKEKLEEANETVAKTSINLSQHDLKEVFVINQTPQLEGRIVFQLEEKTQSTKNEKTVNK
jgi:hypothetical protein